MNKIVELIKKVAQEDTIPERTSVKSDLPPEKKSVLHIPEQEFGISEQVNQPKQKVVQYTSPSIFAVKQMQQTMQELARVVMRDSESAYMPKRPDDFSQVQAPESTKIGKDAFNNFLAENFMSDLPEGQRGVEWSKDPNITSMKDKKVGETSIYELDVVMNTIKRIGNPKSELVVDGIWGPRTNNALLNIRAFTYALLQVEGQLGLPNNIYTVKDLNNFTNDLSNYDKTSSEEKKERATRITENLKKIIILYNDFRRQVLSRPDFRQYIENQKAFATFNTTGTNKDILTPEEDKYSRMSNINVDYVQYYAPNFKGKTKSINYIPLWALTSKENYFKWMKSVGVIYSREDGGKEKKDLAIEIFNKVIKPRIDELKG